jgi:hypothetical protein
LGAHDCIVENKYIFFLASATEMCENVFLYTDTISLEPAGMVPAFPRQPGETQRAFGALTMAKLRGF